MLVLNRCMIRLRFVWTDDEIFSTLRVPLSVTALIVTALIAFSQATNVPALRSAAATISLLLCLVSVLAISL